MGWAVMSCKSGSIDMFWSVSTELDAEKRLALQEEKQELEHKLLEAPKLRDRLEELKAVKTERERARAL